MLHAPSSRVAPVPPAPDVRPRHRARARARHRRRGGRLHRRRRRAAAAAAVSGSRHSWSTLWDTNHEPGLGHEPLSPVNFMDYRSARRPSRDAAGVVAAGCQPRGARARIRSASTRSKPSANLFDVLGVAPQVGPGFPKERAALQPPIAIAVISDRLWRDAIQRRPDDRRPPDHASTARPTPIVGVMPPRFDFPGRHRRLAALEWDFRQPQPRRAFHGGDRAAWRRARPSIRPTRASQR